jgi:glycosyltransferase involved in cell wall biosynthesis
VPRHLRRRTEGTAGGAEQGLPGRGRRLPVVTSDTRPQREAFSDAAVFIRPGDADALARALRTLAEDPPALAKLRAAARDRARERFAPAVVVSALRERLGAPVSRWSGR